MGRLSKAILVAAIATGGAKETARFEPRAVNAYPARETVDKVTIAVEAFRDGEKIKSAFGKANPLRRGVVPVLLIIANDSDRVLQLAGMRVELITEDRQRIDPIPGEDVERTASVRRPKLGGGAPPTIPGRLPGRRGHQPAWEIEAREFSARMIPAGSKAHGFFYFRIGQGPDRIGSSKVYITGIRDARTGQDLMYFEINLDPSDKTK